MLLSGSHFPKRYSMAISRSAPQRHHPTPPHAHPNNTGIIGPTTAPPNPAPPPKIREQHRLQYPCARFAISVSFSPTLNHPNRHCLNNGTSTGQQHRRRAGLGPTRLIKSLPQPVFANRRMTNTIPRSTPSPAWRRTLPPCGLV